MFRKVLENRRQARFWASRSEIRGRAAVTALTVIIQSAITSRVGRGKSLVIRFQLLGPNAIDPQKELELLVAANGSMEKISGVGDTAQMLITSSGTGLATRLLML